MIARGGVPCADLRPAPSPHAPTHHRESPLNEFCWSTPDRDDVTVAVLAVELDTGVHKILQYTDWMKLAVDPVTRTLSAVDADRLRDLFAFTDGTPPSAAPAEPIPGVLAGPVTAEYDPIIANIEQMLNVPRRKRQNFRNRHWPQRPPRSREPAPTGGTAAAARRQWPGMHAEDAQRVAAMWTGRHLFTDAEAEAWWKAGLHYREVEMAHLLASLRVEPWMIELELNKDTVLYKLRNGLAPEQAAALLRRAGHLKAG
jgi:hypothetical protein